MANVLVTSGLPRMAYSIGKELSKQGFRVFTGDSSRISMGRFSRYSAGGMRYAPPENEEAFLRDIERFMHEKRIDILLPTVDETFVIAKNAGRLSSLARFLLPSYSQMEAVHNKDSITRIARSLGIPVPETWEAADLLDDERQLASLPFPVLIKPKQGKGGWGMAVSRTPADLRAAIRNIEGTPHEYIVQRFIEGFQAAACALYKDGACVASDVYTYSKMFPLQFGQSTVRETIRNDSAAALLKKLLDHLEWNGPCEIDFLVENGSGAAYLLDVNPRFWGAIAHNIAAGVNYPYYYCQLCLGNTDFAVGAAAPCTKTKSLGSDMQRVFAEFLSAKDKLGYLKRIFQEKERYAAYDDWDGKDPLPFLAWLLRSLLTKLGRAAKKFRRPAA